MSQRLNLESTSVRNFRGYCKLNFMSFSYFKDTGHTRFTWEFMCRVQEETAAADTADALIIGDIDIIINLATRMKKTRNDQVSVSFVIPFPVSSGLRNHKEWSRI